MSRLVFDKFCSYNNNPKELIDWFSGTYNWLSNFYPTTFYYDKKKYPSVEHAYQANKTDIEELSEMIRIASSAGAAKRMGKIVPLRRDWETFKLDLMKTLIHLKFENPILRTFLLQTGDAKLVECNTWGDKFWGVFKNVGENHLGNIIMLERNRLKKEAKLDE
jgi:ribA/ribD-fused uncharacterized protein